MSAHTHDYAALLAETRPEVIHGEEQNRKFIATLEQLTSKQAVSDAEAKLIELLIVLVESYESKHHALPEIQPVDLIRHLMEAQDFEQEDLVDVFGTVEKVSEVLEGKLELTRDQIKALSARFHVSPVVFF